MKGIIENHYVIGLSVEPIIGQDVKTSIKTLIKFSKEHDLEVSLNFNGIILEINKDTGIEKLYIEYHSKLYGDG